MAKVIMGSISPGADKKQQVINTPDNENRDLLIINCSNGTIKVSDSSVEAWNSFLYRGNPVYIENTGSEVAHYVIVIDDNNQTA
jgi:hypothetical protein